MIILLTCAIYIRVGLEIWKWRRKVNSIGKRSKEQLSRDPRGIIDSAHEITRTDEVIITREGTNGHFSAAQGSQPIFTPNTIQHRARAAFSRRFTIGGSGSKTVFQSSSTSKATMRYCKCASLFFLFLSIVWVPSSVNRIYTLVYPDRVVFGLQFAAALVLPLQGFCNFFIYFMTSSYAIKCLWRDTMVRLGLRKPNERVQTSASNHKFFGSSQDSSREDGRLGGYGPGHVREQSAPALPRVPPPSALPGHQGTHIESDADTIAGSDTNTTTDSDADTLHHVQTQ